jgi:tetratricopeptide (TPR) repeat protein
MGRKGKGVKNHITGSEGSSTPYISEIVLKRWSTGLLCLVLFVLFYTPYLRGLFFEHEQFPAQILVFITFLGFMAYKLLKRDKRFLETPLDYAAIGFVVVYGISVFMAVSSRTAISEWLKYCMYFAVYFMVSELAVRPEARKAAMWTIVASAVGVGLLGIDGAAGSKTAQALNLLLRNLGWSKDVFFGLFIEGRIYSTLQYPNTLAAYLLVAFHMTIGLILVSDKLWHKLTAGICGYILLLAAIFTFSRGALILLPLSLLILVAVLPKGTRVKGAGYVATLILATGAVALKLYSYIGNSGNEQKIWFSVFVGMLAAAGLSAFAYWILQRLEKLPWKIYLYSGAFLALVLASGTLFVLNAQEALTISSVDGQPGAIPTVKRSMTLEPGTSYRFLYEVDARATEGEAYTIGVKSQTWNEVLLARESTLVESTEAASTGVEQREVKFTVPEKSELISIYFTCIGNGKKAVFRNARLIDEAAGKVEKSLILRYKYLPEGIVYRFENLSLTKSGLERVIFYKDGLELFGKHWLMGAGGGAWSQLYQSHQSYFYHSTQAHNYVLQLAIECGIIGLSVFVYFIAMLIASFVTMQLTARKMDMQTKIWMGVFFSAVLFAFIHAAMDFDFSLSAYYLVVWVILALFNGVLRENRREIIARWLPEVDELSHTCIVEKEKASAKVSDLTEVLQILRRSAAKGMARVMNIRKIGLHPVLGFILSILVIIIPVTLRTGTTYSEKSLAAYQAGDVKLSMDYMKRAIESDPFSAEYKIDYANIVRHIKDRPQDMQLDADNKMEEAYEQVNHNADLLVKAAMYYFATGKLEAGLKAADAATAARPLRPEEWQQRVDAYQQVILHYFSKGENTKALDYIDKVLNLAEEARRVNASNLDPFIFTVATTEMLERLKYVKDHILQEPKIEVQKVAFYQIPEMDVNGDKVPDQWSANGQEGIQISGTSRVLQVLGSQGYIQSRVVNMVTGKTYRLEMKLVGNTERTEVPFEITGVVSKDKGKLVREGDKYTAVIVVPADFKNDNNVIRLGVNRMMEIESLVLKQVE